MLSVDGRAEFESIWAPIFTTGSNAKTEDVGRAAARVVEADRRHQAFGYRLSIWKQAVGASAPSLPIVIIDNSALKRPVTLPCSRCRIVSAEDVDKGVFRLFTGGSRLISADEEIVLADRAGKLAFRAAVSDTIRAPELAVQAKMVASTR